MIRNWKLAEKNKQKGRKDKKFKKRTRERKGIQQCKRKENIRTARKPEKRKTRLKFPEITTRTTKGTNRTAKRRNGNTTRTEWTLATRQPRAKTRMLRISQKT